MKVKCYIVYFGFCNHTPRECSGYHTVFSCISKHQLPFSALFTSIASSKTLHHPTSEKHTRQSICMVPQIKLWRTTIRNFVLIITWRNWHLSSHVLHMHTRLYRGALPASNHITYCNQILPTHKLQLKIWYSLVNRILLLGHNTKHNRS